MALTQTTAGVLYFASSGLITLAVLTVGKTPDCVGIPSSEELPLITIYLKTSDVLQHGAAYGSLLCLRTLPCGRSWVLTTENGVTGIEKSLVAYPLMFLRIILLLLTHYVQVSLERLFELLSVALTA
jgi:hypothetical protein